MNPNKQVHPSRTQTEPNLMVLKEIEKIKRRSISQLETFGQLNHMINSNESKSSNENNLNETNQTNNVIKLNIQKDIGFNEMDLSQIEDESDLEVFEILHGDVDELEIFHDDGNENVIELSIVSKLDLTTGKPPIDCNQQNN